mgnify:CR=1 FL=1|tara:strand:+ start:810 stop:1157 length:348 start_codon:yes stop_codon:yes gene_type:complete
MENLVLKYDHRYILKTINKMIPEECKECTRIKNMKIMFENALTKDPWNTKKLYILFMMINSFEEIKTHFLEYEGQHRKWSLFITLHLKNVTEKHINFTLNAKEYVNECLDMFFIL